MDIQAKKNYRLSKDCDLTDQLLERRNESSPDFLDLKNFKNIPVFIYGTEMTGNRHVQVMLQDDPIYLGEACTSTSTYELHKTEQDAPIAFATKGGSRDSWPIYGEVFLVSPKTLLSLDQFEANMEMTQRGVRWVWLLEQQIKPSLRLRPSTKAWVYLGRPDYWEDQKTFKMKTVEVESRRVYMWTNTFSDADIPDFLKKKEK